MSTATQLSDRPSRWTPRFALAVRILLTITFVAAGGAKLAGVPAMVQVFDAIGIGQWFRIVTGTVEIAGAVLLIIPATVGYGAALMTATMAFAVLTHLVHIGGSPTPAIVLLVLSGFVLWVRRADLTGMVASKRAVAA